MMEAYDNDNDLYHHSQMPDDARHFGAVEVWGTVAQPIPGTVKPHYAKVLKTLYIVDKFM